jgi:hypothetical protein
MAQTETQRRAATGRAFRSVVITDVARTTIIESVLRILTRCARRRPDRELPTIPNTLASRYVAKLPKGDVSISTSSSDLNSSPTASTASCVRSIRLTFGHASDDLIHAMPRASWSGSGESTIRLRARSFWTARRQISLALWAKALLAGTAPAAAIPIAMVVKSWRRSCATTSEPIAHKGTDTSVRFICYDG